MNKWQKYLSDNRMWTPKVAEACKIAERLGVERIQKFVDEIGEWARNTFPNQTAISKTKHMQKEVNELLESLENADDENAIVEMADIFILLVNTASLKGLSFEDLLKVAKNKMRTNKSRTWSTPDKDGVCQHIK